NPGWLDLDPFAPGDADSFFDVFFQIDVGGGLVLHNEEPIRIESVMDHKPAATFHFLPVLPGEPIELFDAAGRPTGIFLTTPAPPVDDDRYEFTMLDVGGPTDEVTITFSHSQGDLDMGLRDSGGALLEASASSTDNETVSLDGVPAGTYYVQVVPYMGAFNPNYSLTIDPPPAPANVAARQIFYNNSAWDGNDPAANPSDDGAIAPDKTVLRAGGVVSFANYSSYWRGINGIMIDIDNPTDTPTDADVGIRVNDAANPDRWSAGPVPTVSVRPGDGVGGSDRVTLIWPDEAITNQWVEVTMLATANTGLSADDVFYFANTIGDCDGDGEVDSSDYGVLVGEFGLRGGIATLAADLNADGRMNLTDFAIMRGAIGNSVLTPTIPAAAPEAAPAAPTATPPAGVEPIASVAARVGPVIGQLLDDRDTNNDPSTAAASAVAIDLLLPSPSATGYISEPGLISVGSPTTTLQRAATSEYDLRPLSDDMAVDEVDDSLADILAESALALPL
ncbi:MAG: pre-peptidase C-terminal domain-containing protein, partial [Phycisphaerae bacterium]|nr:pre-peptidase C-terminal domain-containing protein [Phycisphaerae bacterium]